MLAAADAVLECMASAGVSCLYASPLADAWAAQHALEAVAKLPAPLLPNALLRAADELGTATVVARRIDAEAERMIALTRDLTCKPVRTRSVGAELDLRRRELVSRAEDLGLATTVAGPAVGALAATAEPMASVRLVEARCQEGAVFLLLAPPRGDLAPDEDPAAHAGGGWRVFAAGYDEQRLLRGEPAPPPAPRIVDSPRGDGLDPWIPATEIDL